MPRISVCITHYNRPHKLSATLESLANQTRVPDEVFLWDDCSPNDPSEVAKAFQGRFPHFVYHRNECNLNMPGNLNAVIAQATGEYIANLHDADIFEPTLLEKWEHILDTHPSSGLVFCGYDSERNNPAKGRIYVHDIPTLTSGRAFFEKWFIGNAGSVIWGTVMARKTVYDKLLPFDPTYRNWADVDMWLRICRNYDIAYVAEPLIILDNTPTPLRQFSWYKLLLTHYLIISNIEWFYAGNTLRLDVQRRRQVRLMRLNFVRHLLGGIRRWDWNRILNASVAAKKIWRGSLDVELLEKLHDQEMRA